MLKTCNVVRLTWHSSSGLLPTQTRSTPSAYTLQSDPSVTSRTVFMPNSFAGPMMMLSVLRNFSGSEIESRGSRREESATVLLTGELRADPASYMVQYSGYSL